MNSIAQIFWNTMAASRAILRRVCGVHKYHFSTSVFCFVRKALRELRPCRIGNTFSKAVIMNHAIHIQVFNGDYAKPVYEFPTRLMREIIAAIRNALMNTSDRFTPILSFRRPLFFFRHAPLRFSQRFFIGSKKPWIGNLIASGKCGETGKPDINANHFVRSQRWSRFYFTRDGGKPLPGRCAGDCYGFGRPLQFPMPHHANTPDFRQMQTAFINSPSRLRIGNGVVSVSSAKAWIARLFTRFCSAEKCFKCKIDAHRNILEDLGIHAFESFAFVFQNWKFDSLLVISKRFLLLFPCVLALFKKMVIEPPAFLKSCAQNGCLFMSRTQAIFECFKHSI